MERVNKNYYLVFEDDVFEKLCLLKDLPDVIQKIIMYQAYEVDDSLYHWSETITYQYTSFYELNTSYKFDQVKAVLVHEFYVDVLELAKCLGKIEKVII
jgi:hypothetical protein